MGGLPGAGGSNLVTPSFVEVDSYSTLMRVLAPVRLSRYDYPDGTSTGSAVLNVSGRHRQQESVTPGGCRVCPYYSTCSDRGTHSPDRDYRSENARRARDQVKRYVRTHDLRRLLTFTNGGSGAGFRSRRETLDTFARWLKVHGSLLGQTPVAVVAERGGRGGRWHIHAVIRSGYRLDYNRIRDSWSVFLSKRGYISPTGLHRFHAGDDSGKHPQGFTSARVAALYVAKYIGKHLEDEEREESAHRYRTYGGDTPKPVVHRYRSLRAAGAALGEIGWYYPLEYLDAGTGELKQYGFLFDTAPGP